MGADHSILSGEIESVRMADGFCEDIVYGRKHWEIINNKMRIRNGKGIMKSREKLYSIIGAILIILLVSACGQKESDGGKSLEGSLNDILGNIYETADLSDDFREVLEYYETYELTDDIELSILGTDEITYTEGIVSMPMQSSVAYQCVLLRVDEKEIDTIKQQLKDNANLDKWVCVSAETMLIESRDDVILFIMGDESTVYALNSAFQNL